MASRNLEHLLGVNQFFTDLAGHERTHDGCRLRHWWPASRLARFNPPGSTAYGAVHADGLGVWTERDRTVAFYLEHDTGTEALTVLVDKLAGYTALAQRGGPGWPVLFWLHSAAREANLHRRLADARVVVPVATAARDRVDPVSPADPIWHLHGEPGPRRRLVEVPTREPVDPFVFDEALKAEYDARIRT
jgi:hypothetical protein